MIADIFNKPLHVSKHSDSIGLGAFLLSAIEIGIYKDLDEAAGTVVLPDNYRPDRQNHDVYNKYFKIFESLSLKLVDEFESISDLQHKRD
jgi:gluconokinase